MFVVKHVHYRIDKHQNTGDVFDRVTKSLLTAEQKFGKLWFHLEDDLVLQRKTLGTDRILKAYPALMPFFRKVESAEKKCNLISNLNMKWHYGTETAAKRDCSIAELSAIAHGIPNRFPLWSADFCFDGIAALDLRKERHLVPDRPLMISSPETQSISLSSHWSTPRRCISLIAGISFGCPPENAESLPDIPEPTRQFLNALGPIDHIKLTIEPSAAELKKRNRLWVRSRELADRILQNPFAGCDGAQLPFKLSLPKGGSTFGVPQSERKKQGIPSVKKLLIEAFKPLGYRYSRNYELTKIAASNAVLKVSVDVSPMCGEWTSHFSVLLPLGSCGVSLPVSPAGSKYPVNNELPKVVLNAAYIVNCLEKTLVPKAEQIWGCAPKWFAHEYLIEKRM